MALGPAVPPAGLWALGTGHWDPLVHSGSSRPPAPPEPPSSPRPLTERSLSFARSSEAVCPELDKGLLPLTLTTSS